jgi:ADP-heptose:LPS heptosyltransferase
MDRLLSLVKPASSIGFDKAFQVALPLDFSKHSADLAFDLVRAVEPSMRIEDFASHPDLSPGALELAATVRRLLPQATLLAIHADSKQEKVWPAGRFRNFLTRLLARVPHLFVLDLGLQNMRLDKIVYGDRVIWCGQAPLGPAMGLVKIANLFIGVDSCFLHAADLFRVPGVGLFGPTRPEEFGFRFGPHRHVVGKSTMEDILEETVMDAVESLDAETGCLGGLLAHSCGHTMDRHLTRFAGPL